MEARPGGGWSVMPAWRDIEGDLGRLVGLLARGERPDVREAKRIASSVLRAVRPPAPRVAAEDDAEQLSIALRFLGAAELIDECPLGMAPRADCCVARQIASQNEVGEGPAVKRSSPAKRGRLATFVQCRTELCSVGAGVRARLGDTPEAVEMAKHAPRVTDASNT